MALAFKRAVAEAQAEIDSANASIKGWYSPPSDPALIINWEDMKKVEGNSTQNANSEEKPKSLTCVNWVKDNAGGFHSVWGNIQYKDDKHALPIALKYLDKVIISVDDKSPAGAYNTYSCEFRGKDLHITVHLDFTQYPQAFNLGDEKFNIDWFVWGHLNDVGHIAYELKKTSLTSGSSNLQTYQNYLAEKITKKKVPMEIDWESCFKCQGKSLEYENKPLVPNNYRAANYIDEKACYNVYYAIETLVKDDLGMDAFLDTFDKVVISVGTSTEESSGPHAITKDGKTLKFQFKLNFENLQNASADYSEMAKQVEALL